MLSNRVGPDLFDDLRREWISEHAGIFTMQKRRAELLNQQIRRRNRDAAGARPNPYDDNVIHPIIARPPKTFEASVELIVVAVAALMAPLGWLLGRLIYTQLVQFIPDRLRAYPVPALLFTGFGVGVLPALMYSPGDSFTTAVLAPYLIAQVPAAFAIAGIYGILNGWLTIDGSTDWWPLAPAPIPVELDLPLGPDDLTRPSMFLSDDVQQTAHVPHRQLGRSTQSVRLVACGLLVCAIGSAWMTGAVVAGVKELLTGAFSNPYAATQRR